MQATLIWCMAKISAVDEQDAAELEADVSHLGDAGAFAAEVQRDRHAHEPLLLQGRQGLRRKAALAIHLGGGHARDGGGGFDAQASRRQAGLADPEGGRHHQGRIIASNVQHRHCAL